MSYDSFKKRSKIFKALAHPTRLFIVDKLSEKECCVCEFVEKLNVDFSTISKHLSVLKNAGIVADEKRGQQVFYKLIMQCVGLFNRCIDNFLMSHESASSDCKECHLSGDNK